MGLYIHINVAIKLLYILLSRVILKGKLTKFFFFFFCFCFLSLCQFIFLFHQHNKWWVRMNRADKINGVLLFLYVYKQSEMEWNKMTKWFNWRIVVECKRGWEHIIRWDWNMFLHCFYIVFVYKMTFHILR